MNIIFLGGFFPEQYTHSILIKSKLEVQNAANGFQWAFIKGLERNLNKSIQLITAPYIGWYPKYFKEISVKTSIFSNNEKKNACIMVGFLNLPLIKNVFRYFNTYPFIINSFTPQEKNVLIVYSLNLDLLLAAFKAKQKNPNLLICVIITDLIDFPGDSSIFSKIYLTYFEKPLVTDLLKKVDCFVVLADKIVDFLNLHSKPYIRIEGIYDENVIQYPKSKSTEDSNKIVLYTGTLDYRYGIKELLDAFQLIAAKDFRLWICGGGPGSDMVLKRMKEDHRIKYFGIVSKEKVIALQSQATLLVNPRNTIGEYNKYSFPSKTMEYLASGTPSLLYKLDGIPDEYFDYCYTVEDNDIDSFAKAIYNTSNIDASILTLKGKSARDFILKNKTAKIQCSKVLNMFSKL